MIEERRLTCWSKFKDEITRIRKEYGYHTDETSEGQQKNTVLFRGHCNATWSIKTTLERALERKRNANTVDIEKYMGWAYFCLNEIESITGRRWDLPTLPRIREEVYNNNDEFRCYLPAYDFLVYLRHHGFPSPLLDWSESPYVAAFFAFLDEARPRAKRVAILAYIDSLGSTKSNWGGSSTITLKGPLVTTDPRHFAQKAWYTVATKWDGKKRCFCPHEDILSRRETNQDLLIKITLPSSARKEALTELSDYNINPFTLFQTEDALIRTMELKQFDLED